MSGLRLPTLDAGCSVDSFVERLECYFLLEEVKQDNKKVQVLIMGLSSDQYGVLRDLTSPQKPKDMVYNDLVDALKRYYGKTTHWMVERQSFRDVRQQGDESIAEFAAKIKNKARDCSFGNQLDVNIAEQFLRGLHDETLRHALLQLEDGLLVDITQLVNKANMRVQLKPPRTDQSTVAAVRKKYSCCSCGRSGHNGGMDCPAKNKICYMCGKRGHFANYCTEKGKGASRRVYGVTEDDDSDDDTLF